MLSVTLTPPAHRSAPYPILIGRRACASLGDILGRSAPVDGVFIVHDRAVEHLAATVAASEPRRVMIPVASGESSKTLKEAERIASEMLRQGATRRSLVIGVGGGMVTDLAGFVASVFMRGIRCIHVPTSLLAMVDAAIGGKTAVDLGDAKNMLGTIHHPIAIVADTEMLVSLGYQQLCEGLVESIKMAAILDAGHFGWIESHIQAIVDRDPESLAECIARSVEMKAAVVADDERDEHRRLLLNFGHTVGHAVEALSGFAVSHGQAVAIGMACEMRMAGTDGADRVLALLRKINMPVALPDDYDTDRLWRLMQSDKKSVAGDVRMAAPPRIGDGEVRSITLDAFRRARA